MITNYDEISEGFGAIESPCSELISDTYLLVFKLGTDEERLAKAIIAALDRSGRVDVDAFRAIWEGTNDG